jgi:hypothetical protein
MKTELQQKLLTKYPEFFQTKKRIYTGENSIHEDVQELLNQEEIVEPIQFGFEVGDGWYWLLNTLMGTIHSYCKDNGKPYPNITQIKEKFSGLRFYYNGGDDMIDGMVWLAESQSYYICETCGTTINVGRTSGWMTTICEDCYKKNERINSYKWMVNG